MKKNLFFLLLVFTGHVKSQVINTVAGNGYGAGTGMSNYSGDGGPATAAEMGYTYGVAFDGHNNMYISDWGYGIIRKVNTSGIITSVAGTPTGGGYSGDGGPATAAELSSPQKVAFDHVGNMYIPDVLNNVIRKVDTFGIITTVVGSYTAGMTYTGDGGQATSAGLNFPNSVIFDPMGNLYISDGGNNAIRKVNTLGIISTIAGVGTTGYSGDGGQATLAKLNNPWGLAFDASGNLYFSDNGNNCIRRINSSGIITTVAGTGTGGYGGDGGLATLAQLSGPYGICVDPRGNLYIADLYNVRVRMVDTSGIITTVAGTGAKGYSGDGGSPVLAKLNDPSDVAFDGLGNLYIDDAYNNVIRAVTNATNLKSFNSEKSILVYPNPTKGQFTIETNSVDKQILDLYDVNGKHVFSKCVVGTADIDADSLDNGLYTLTIKNGLSTTNKKIVIAR
jgi:hypothetical protein